MCLCKSVSSKTQSPRVSRLEGYSSTWSAATARKPSRPPAGSRRHRWPTTSKEQQALTIQVAARRRRREARGRQRARGGARVIPAGDRHRVDDAVGLLRAAARGGVLRDRQRAAAFGMGFPCQGGIVPLNRTARCCCRAARRRRCIQAREHSTAPSSVHARPQPGPGA